MKPEIGNLKLETIMDAKVEKIIQKYDANKAFLVPILQDVQGEFNYLPQDRLYELSTALKVPISQIYEVATFYKAFSLVPKGRHQIHVCTGTACHVRGAGRILEVVEDVTGLKPGLTDQDFKFSLETVNCVGCCALGPVMIVDGEHHGKLAPAKSKDVLKNYE